MGSPTQGDVSIADAPERPSSSLPPLLLHQLMLWSNMKAKYSVPSMDRGQGDRRHASLLREAWSEHQDPGGKLRPFPNSAAPFGFSK